MLLRKVQKFLLTSRENRTWMLLSSSVHSTSLLNSWSSFIWSRHSNSILRGSEILINLNNFRQNQARHHPIQSPLQPVFAVSVATARLSLVCGRSLNDLKAPTSFIESNYCLHTGPPKIQALCLRVCSRHLVDSGRIWAVTVDSWWFWWSHREIRFNLQEIPFQFLFNYLLGKQFAN